MGHKPILGRLTPVHAADREVHAAIGENTDDVLLSRYEAARDRYLHLRHVYHVVRVLFYASLISTIATAIGINEVRVIQSVASYIGTPLLLALLLLARYLGSVQRERYYVAREHLIADAAGRQS